MKSKGRKGSNQGTPTSEDLEISYGKAVEALDLLESEVAADCLWCGGEGSWTEGEQPEMTAVRHHGACPIVTLKAIIAGHDLAKAEGRQ